MAETHDSGAAELTVKRRYGVSIVLGVIAAVLIAGGVQLISLGGSPYYLVAGLLAGASSIELFKGRSRGILIYIGLLLLTLVWAVWESGLDPWGIQARLFAPAVLFLWVAWPWLRRLPKMVSLPLAALLVLPLAYLFISADSFEKGAMSFSKVATEDAGAGEWLAYGNDMGGTRYSRLSQITPVNVGHLENVWTYNTGKVDVGMAFETTPLMVKDTLYLCAPDGEVHAVDPETGERRWVYDPKPAPHRMGVCRGVSYYKVPEATGPCAERIIWGNSGGTLVAIDRITGKACQDFGVNGSVDLKHGMGKIILSFYHITSPPAIVNGNVVIGGWVSDNQMVGSPPGVVRAYDAVTGELAWAFDMDHPERIGAPPEGETYSLGTANSWAPMSGDEALGLVFVPTGNSTPDYWGAHRSPGSEKYSSSVLALDSRTGRVRWHFQTSHHDLWDYDVASQPTLIDLPIKGEVVPALLMPTKRGEVFLLDRRNGTPLAEVEERPVPQSPAEGDWTSPTQPFSVGMPSFATAEISERRMWGATPLDQLWCRIAFKKARYDGTMTPPGVKPSIGYPGYLGGIDWGSVAVDPDRRKMVVNWSIIANHTRLIPRSEVPHITVSETGSVHVGDPTPMMGTPFALENGPFLSPLGMPCNQPPYGKIAVVDLDTRKIEWERNLGTSRDNGPFGFSTHVPLPMGVPNMGGSLVTRSGLVFIGAAREKTFRAFDLETGKLLWAHRTPATPHATAMTYTSPKSGRQFIVIAAGGNDPMGTPRSDAVLAFALPQSK